MHAYISWSCEVCCVFVGHSYVTTPCNTFHSVGFYFWRSAILTETQFSIQNLCCWIFLVSPMIYFCLSHNTRADIWVFIHDKTCSEKGKKYSKKKTGEEGEGESKVVGKYPNKQIPPPGPHPQETHKRPWWTISLQIILVIFFWLAHSSSPKSTVVASQIVLRTYPSSRFSLSSPTPPFWNQVRCRKLLSVLIPY